MKKLLSLLVASSIVFVLAGCGEPEADPTVPLQDPKTAKPGDPQMAGVGGAGGGSAPQSGGPAAPSTE